MYLSSSFAVSSDIGSDGSLVLLYHALQSRSNPAIGSRWQRTIGRQQAQECSLSIGIVDNTRRMKDVHCNHSLTGSIVEFDHLLGFLRFCCSANGVLEGPLLAHSSVIHSRQRSQFGYRYSFHAFYQYSEGRLEARTKASRNRIVIMNPSTYYTCALLFEKKYKGEREMSFQNYMRETNVTIQ